MKREIRPVTLNIDGDIVTTREIFSSWLLRLPFMPKYGLTLPDGIRYRKDIYNVSDSTRRHEYFHMATIHRLALKFPKLARWILWYIPNAKDEESGAYIYEGHIMAGRDPATLRPNIQVVSR